MRRGLPSGVSGHTVFSAGALKCHRCVFLSMRLLLSPVVSAIDRTRFLSPFVCADAPNPQYWQGSVVFFFLIWGSASLLLRQRRATI